MYHYYQIEEKQAWTPVREKDLEATLKEVEGIRKVSILAVSDLINPDAANADSKKYTYKGPLYFDIDCADDLKLAIESGKSLCEKLIEAGVPEAGLRVYASGSKGIHVTLDQQYFSAGRPVRGLAKIYREMAREFYVPGMDFQVYSSGKGNCWRRPNSRRDDGNYKVPILVEELSSLTEESYRDLCRSPRFNVVPLEPKPFKIMELEALFEACRKRVNAKAVPAITATEPELAMVKDTVPACIQQVADYKDILADKNYNEVAMQLGIYIARSGVSPTVADGLISRLADNGSSSQYSSLRQKLDHVKGQVAYMRNSKQYGFSCGSMRSLLARPPCAGCPLENTAAGAHSASQSGGIIERDCQFFMRGLQQDKMITNFSLMATDIFIDVPQDGGRLRRAGIKVDLRYRDEVHASFVMDERCWASRSNFIGAIEGQAARVPEIFYGSDAEVQKIKHYVMSQEPDMGEIYQVWTCGIHMDIVSNTEVFTYVEPGLSINSNKVSGTHELAGKMLARPYFGTTTLPTPGDEIVDEVMHHLLNINRAEELSQMVGWFVACHLKTHLTTLYSQFPLLGIWGNAGSGKCLRANTEVLMHNGSIKKVQDIREGDKVMGPDSKPRTVQGTCKGRGPMYRINPVKGDPWVCNDAHVMTLTSNNNKKDQVFDIPLREWLENQHLTRNNRAKLFRVPVNFPAKATEFDPYLVGVWIGDGTRRQPYVTTGDKEVKDYLQGICVEYGWGCEVKYSCPRETAWLVQMGSDGIPRTTNPAKRLVKHLTNGTGHKIIPKEYLVNSRKVRLQLLAGLLDTDGHLHCNCYEITNKCPEVAKDILFLARSLGLSAYCTEKSVQLKTWDEPRVYCRISICGDTSMIPCKVPRKRATKRKQAKSGLRTGFSVTAEGVGDYYGFTLDGDSRFLLGDFTVTHNSAQSGLLSWLNGTDYSVRDTPANVSNITPYAVIEYCASTTTVPRLVEEFNKSKMRSSSYKQVGETLKAAWNGETILRGGLGKRNGAGRTGAIVNEIPVTSPLVVMSEQQMEAPALQERSLRIKLSKDIRSGRTDHYHMANRGKEHIRRVGKALMIRALKTTLNEVEGWMLETDALLDKGIDDRPRYSYQVAMLGLKFLRKVSEEHLKLPRTVVACDGLIDALERKFEWLGQNISSANARSEVDNVMDAFNIMMGLTSAGGGEAWLKEGVHVVKGPEDVIYMDIVLSHANYNKYSMHHMRQEDRVLTGSVANFATLLKDEAYYDGEEFVEGIGQNKRTFTKLRLEKMKMKGINVSYFEAL